MENAENALKDFEDYFNLSPSNSAEQNQEQQEQAEEYGDITESDDDFDTLSEEVSETIGAMEDEEKGYELPQPIKKDEIKEEVKEKEEEEVRDEVEEDDQEDKEEVKEEVPFDLDEEKEDFIPTPTRTSAKHFYHKYEDEIEERSKMENNKIRFFLDSPAGLFDNFYAKKRDLVFSNMPGGQIDFDAVSLELQDAGVDICSEIFDPEESRKQMELVQQHRERIKNISIRTNNQFFIWKRWVPLLEGFLARVQYLKPQIKQDGLVLEHMSDVELYLARLESLHNNVTAVEKTLAAAYETLSRKVSICMELKSSERYERPKSASYVSKFSEETSSPIEKKVISKDIKPKAEY